MNNPQPKQPFVMSYKDIETLQRLAGRCEATSGILSPSETLKLAIAASKFATVINWFIIKDRQVAEQAKFANAPVKANYDVRFLEEVWTAFEQFGVEMPP